MLLVLKAFPQLVSFEQNIYVEPCPEPADKPITSQKHIGTLYKKLIWQNIESIY